MVLLQSLRALLAFAALTCPTLTAASSVSPRACGRTITAKQGDTCATLSTEAGISVTQFIQSNPGITSCSALVAGTTYCVDAPSGTSTTPVTTSTSTPLKISNDGTCGSGTTCTGSKFGNCCSEHGFCGSTDAYCGTGCNAAFGTCGSGGGGSSSDGGAGTTQGGGSGPVATSTVWATATTTVTSTAIVSSVAIGTAITTATRTATVTSTALSYYVITATSTSLVYKTSTLTATAMATATTTKTINTVLTTITTFTLTLTTGVAATCPGGNGPPGTIYTTIYPTPTVSTGITTVSSAPHSSGTLPGTVSSCTKYDVIASGDTCRKIARRNNLLLADFYKMNPSIDCDDLWIGYSVCVAT